MYIYMLSMQQNCRPFIQNAILWKNTAIISDRHRIQSVICLINYNGIDSIGTSFRAACVKLFEIFDVYMKNTPLHNVRYDNYIRGFRNFSIFNIIPNPLFTYDCFACMLICTHTQRNVAYTTHI